jgi:UDP-N-acetyl-D-glucosamine/UDP-N-acetyl-D-galactosamine dehydrogenase
MYQSLIEKRKKLAVIGLGYVGLPVALAFAKKMSVVAYDLSQKKIEALLQGIDPNQESASSAFEDTDIEFSSDFNALKKAHFYIVTVPTPVDPQNLPDLSALLAATRSLGQVLKKGDYIVYESTTYPGCTEEECLPVLEKISGLRAGADFKIGYSPERINPGDPARGFTRIPKIVSAGDSESLREIAAVYASAVQAGIYQAPSIRVAEAAKLVENTQRDLNIALMNELSMIFDRMTLSTPEVLEAAATKWNFLPFKPGLVGGHCTGVDPYYLAHKASSLGHEPVLIAASRSINDGMADYVAGKIIAHLQGRPGTPKILVKGVTFKENVRDIRNSKIADTVKKLLAHGVQVDIEDPFANPEEVKQQYGIELTAGNSMYDAVVITVPHHPYQQLDDAYFCSITKEDALIADLKAIYKNKIVNRKYWSL